MNPISNIETVDIAQEPEEDRLLNSKNQLGRKVGALRSRISLLNQTVLRINESLDLDFILRETIRAAREFTAARYGIVTTADKTGQPQEFVSVGLTEHQHRQLAEWSDGPRLFQHLLGLSYPLRTTDMTGYVRCLGLSADRLPSRTLVGMALSRQGEHVGNFYLAGKEGGDEFTVEDEECLAMLASHATAAIVNARAYREEQQARADLEAFVDISPVGVVVFDAETGTPLRFNREVERIVKPLCDPGEPLERLMQTMTCRFLNGRTVALDRSSLPRELRGTDALRAAEIELSVPDGRRIIVLVDANPIRSAGGAVKSVIVTLQDPAPLEELGRLRAEFLDMVSHELRAPLTSIKGSATTLLETSWTLGRAEMREFFRIIAEQADQMRGLVGDLLDAGRIDAGMLSVTPEPTEVATLVDRARNAFLGGGSGRDILIDLPPGLPSVMADRQRIVQVLNNLFHNAADNSPASSPIGVAASCGDRQVTISVRDEGRGIAPEHLPMLFGRRARSTIGTDKGGVGLGLAICKGLVEAHGGCIWAESDGPEQGALFSFTIPAIERAPAHAARDGRPGRHRHGNERKRILAVDDDPRTLSYIRDSLTGAGYTVTVTGDPRELSQLIETERPDLILLDLMLPDADGIELMRRLPELAGLPVIFISAYSREETIAQALERGAVDYIVKPLSATELKARVGAALRTPASSQTFELDELAIHYNERRVTVAGLPVNLTATEFELLRALSSNAGCVTTYGTLLRDVWRGQMSNGTERVRTCVRNLRRKLGDNPEEPTYIFNQRGVGYRMPEPGRL